MVNRILNKSPSSNAQFYFEVFSSFCKVVQSIDIGKTGLKYVKSRDFLDYHSKNFLTALNGLTLRKICTNIDSRSPEFFRIRTKSQDYVLLWGHSGHNFGPVLWHNLYSVILDIYGQFLVFSDFSPFFTMYTEHKNCRNFAANLHCTFFSFYFFY